MVAAGGRREWGVIVNEYGTSVCDEEKILEMDTGVGHTA